MWRAMLILLRLSQINECMGNPAINISGGLTKSLVSFGHCFGRLTGLCLKRICLYDMLSKYVARPKLFSKGYGCFYVSKMIDDQKLLYEE